MVSEPIERITEKLSQLFVSEEQGINNNDWIGDTGVEAKYGRRDIGGSLTSWLRRVWYEATNPRKVEKILQRKFLGNQKTAGVQERAAAISEGNARLARFVKTEEYKLFEKFLFQIEAFAYYTIARPEGYFNQQDPKLKGKAISIEYFLGFYNGQLSVIEDWRTMMREAIRFHEREKELERSKQKKNETKSK